jgi:hypothetical protein
MPFLVGILLSVVGGAIGVACTMLAISWGAMSPADGLQLAATTVLIPAALLPGIITAIPATGLLMPLAYYFTRSRIAVTPGRYALWGGTAGLLLCVVMLGLPLWWSGLQALETASVPVASVLVGRAVGTVLAGIICAALFAMAMRSHYRRYQTSRGEAA